MTRKIAVPVVVDLSQRHKPAAAVCLPLGRDAELTCTLMESGGIDCAIYDSAEELLQSLNDESGVVVLGIEALRREAVATRLNDHLDRQPSWSDLPVLLLRSRRSAVDRQERLFARQSVSILERPIQPRTLLAFVSTALETRRRQHDVRNLLRRLERLNARLTSRARQLRTLSERHRAVVDTAADAILAADADRRIDGFNRAAERMFGYCASEVRGWSIERMFCDAHCSILAVELDRMLRHGATEVRYELLARRKDGTLFHAGFSASNLGKRGLTAIIRDISRRKALEKRVAQVATEEREQIARDLHDGVAGQMTGIDMMIRVLEKRLRADGSPHAQTAAEISRDIHEAHAQLREVSHGLMPVQNLPDGLQIALSELAQKLSRTDELSCRFECDKPTSIHDLTVATNYYYIAREAIANAIRHGKANLITILLRQDTGRLTLRVEDNGVGIQSNADGHAGVGLGTMNHRANVIGAGLKIESGKEGGTVVTCELNSLTPCQQEEASKNEPSHVS